MTKVVVSDSDEEDPEAGVSRDKRRLRPKKQRIIDSDGSNAENDSEVEEDEKDNSEEEEAVSSDSDIVVKKKPKRKKAATTTSGDSGSEDKGPRKRRRIRAHSDSDGKDKGVTSSLLYYKYSTGMYYVDNYVPVPIYLQSRNAD